VSLDYNFKVDPIRYEYLPYHSEVTMPNYPYRCLECKRRFEIYMTFSDYGKLPVECPNCKSQNVQRRIGRVRFARSEESRPDNLDGLEDDPRALGRMMRKMGREMGEDMGPEFDEVIDRLEAGQSPEDIEAAMPDLGSGPSEYGGGEDF
jgi:putative FmdB family regulatory protein